MPMTEKGTACSCQASLSSDAISCLQGPHQLAQTLMMSGLPRKSESFRDGPLRPSIVASRSVCPISTSSGLLAMACPAEATTQRISAESKPDARQDDDKRKAIA